jgi:hypothetical protein
VHESVDGPSLQIVHCSDTSGIGGQADISRTVVKCGCNLVTPRLSGRPTQQLRQLDEVHRQPLAPRRASADWSPSGATQRHVQNRGRSGSARLALETTLMTHHGSGSGIVRCPSAKFSTHLPTARPPTICRIAYLDLLERTEPLRRIGVDSTVKLAECWSLDTALLQQSATVVRQFAHLP